MQKSIHIIGAFALIVAASVVSSPHGNFPSRGAAFLPAAEAGAGAEATMSPADMMINYNKPLPVEQWDMS